MSEHLKSFDFESAGELILSSVDRDGTCAGLDFDVAEDPFIKNAPMPVLLNCDSMVLRPKKIVRNI